MRKYILFIYICISLSVVSAQKITFSDSATISLITCSPGEEVYSKFGHTAIRVKDPVNGIDVVFNYGIFSFETNNFYYKFIKGETDYQLGVYETSFFLPEYAARNSMVWEQILNLKVDEKRSLINALLTNYEPENRIYRYNFIFDNCSTRPRDKILAAINGYVKFKPEKEPNTFRQWIGVYVGTNTWLKLGIDVIFGMDADKLATQNESMFLPEQLMINFQNAEVYTFKGEQRNLVQKANVLVNKKEVKEPAVSCLDNPMVVSISLLLIGILITLWDIKRKLHFKLFDSALLLVTGFGGLIAFFLAVFSTHPLVRMNLNLLWLNPLNLVVAVLIWNRSLRKVVFLYEILNIVLLIAALTAFALSIQSFNLATFPIIVLLLMRSTHWFARAKRRIFHNNEFKLDRKFFHEK
ncbi:MAG: DUF4105 domain-containing protein [Paludibacter sp.]